MNGKDRINVFRMNFIQRDIFSVLCHAAGLFWVFSSAFAGSFLLARRDLLLLLLLFLALFPVEFVNDRRRERVADGFAISEFRRDFSPLFWAFAAKSCFRRPISFFIFDVGPLIIECIIIWIAPLPFVSQTFVTGSLDLSGLRRL